MGCFRARSFGLKEDLELNLCLAPQKALSLGSIWKGLLWPSVKEPFYEDGSDLRFEEIIPFIRGLDYVILSNGEDPLPSA